MGMVFIQSCNNQLKTDNDQLSNQIDSLSSQLINANQAIDVLADVSATLDSIESEREIMRIQTLEGGMSDEDYAGRILMLNELLAKAEARVNELDQSNSKTNAIVSKLKRDLAEQKQTITFLENVLEISRKENISLKRAVVRQSDEISDLAQRIDDRKKELTSIEEQVRSMKVEAKKAEAEAYYARAEAYEETANRTRLAPKKKKETLKQALELYKKSEELGYEKAAEKVKELERKVG